MTDNNKENTKQTYSVSGLSCGGCASTIEIRLSSIPKIKSAKVDMHKKQVDIVSEAKVELGQMQRALENTSYQITEL